LEVLHAIRNSSRMVINPMELYGLVTFPSFHTAMALMTAAAWRDDRYLRWPMFIWNALVILSTLPIGGHYVVDVIAGALTWFLVFRYGAAWANFIISARSDATAPALAADL
jgi:membrane-associated phospholipid phosphatase